MSKSSSSSSRSVTDTRELLALPDVFPVPPDPEAVEKVKMEME